MKNKLFKISQTENNYWDTYDSAVVCAPDEEAARHTYPSGYSFKGRLHDYDSQWTKPENVAVQFLGIADESIPVGIVCASFNAG